MTVARRSLIASVLSLLGGCSPAALLNATVPRGGYTRQRDIAYGPLPRQTLDLYRPQTPRADGKSVIFFYGGSWDTGAKGDYLFVGQALASRGITTIIPDYRLYPEVRFPAFIEDAAQATRWAGEHVGLTKLFIAGHSAGAHIASMLAVNTPYLAQAGVDRMKLAGVIGLSGPYDFLPLKSAKLIDIFGGANRPEIEAITFARAPLPRGAAAPRHGRHDGLSAQQREPRRGLAASRRAGRAEALPGVGHIDIVAAFSDLLHKRATTREDVLAFIDAS